MSKIAEFMKSLERNRRKPARPPNLVPLAGHDLGIVVPAFTTEQIGFIERTFNDSLGAVPRVGKIWFVDAAGDPMSTVVRCVGTPKPITEFPCVGIEVNSDKEPVATRSAIPHLLRVVFANASADQDPREFGYDPNEVVHRGQSMPMRCLDVGKYQAAVAEADEAFRWE